MEQRCRHEDGGGPEDESVGEYVRTFLNCAGRGGVTGEKGAYSLTA